MVGPCRWETLPSNLDLISMDFYFVDDGAMEVAKTKRAYGECLLGKLLPHQRVMLVLIDEGGAGMLGCHRQSSIQCSEPLQR
jgi:hypothetical protein